MIHRTFGITALLLAAMISATSAQDKAPSTPFSHKGFKAAIGVGNFEATSELDLDQGEAGALHLGYGFSDNVTLWLTALGVEHPHLSSSSTISEFGGLELNLQYKFRPTSKLQPYGKIGLGGYGLKRQNAQNTTVGGGVNVALGADFFFSKHVGIGAELNFKGIQYESEHRRVGDTDVFQDLPEKLDGDATGFMVTLTLQ